MRRTRVAMLSFPRTAVLKFTLTPLRITVLASLSIWQPINIVQAETISPETNSGTATFGNILNSKLQYPWRRRCNPTKTVKTAIFALWISKNCMLQWTLQLALARRTWRKSHMRWRKLSLKTPIAISASDPAAKTAAPILPTLLLPR